MADENQEQDENEGEQTDKSGGGKLKLVILILAGVLLIASSIGGTLYLLGFFDSEDIPEVVEQEGQEQQKEPKTAQRPPAMYFPIKPPFVVNFQSRGRQRFLQVDVAIMTRNQQVYGAIQTHLPLIKNRLVMLFGGQVYEELQTDEGRELLRQKALEAIQSILDAEIGEAEIDQVLFTNFVMQ